MEHWRIREQETVLLCVSCFLVSQNCCMSASLAKTKPSYPALKWTNQQVFVKYLFVNFRVSVPKGIQEFFLPSEMSYLVSDIQHNFMIVCEKFMLQLIERNCFGVSQWGGMWFLMSAWYYHMAVPYLFNHPPIISYWEYFQFLLLYSILWCGFPGVFASILNDFLTLEC